MWLTRGLAAVCTAGVLVTVPVLDVASGDAPRPVAGEDHEIPVTEGQQVPAASLSGSPSATSVTELTVGDGALVGVGFDARPESPSVQVRVQEDGGWSEWTTLRVESEPDPGTTEARHARAASDPLWIGDGDGDADRRLQVRMAAADTDEASLAVVDPGTSPADDDVVRRGPAATAAAATTSAPQIRSRAQWGADESLRQCPAEAAPTVKAAVLHHTAGTNDYTEDEVPGILRGIYRYHTQTQGWCDIGYNVLVDRFGGLWEGRAGGLTRAVVGAHTGGFNEGTFGVSMIGTYSDVVPSAAVVESVAQVMAWKLGGNYRDPRGSVTLTSAGGGTSRYAAGQSVTLPRIFGHRDVGRTECPGDGGYSVLPQVRDRVAELVGDPSGPVYETWQRAGGASGRLGEPSLVEGSTAGERGRYNHFSGGSVYWTPETGGHVLGGSIRSRWSVLGWERSVLGYPTTDELPTPDGRGRYGHFEGGSVYWSPSTGAHQVGGSIRDRWASLGWERSSVLGYPTTDELPTPDGRGRYNHFESGSVYWTPTTGPQVVRGAIRGAWASLGWERSALGYPTTGETRTPDGRGWFNHFERGSVYWTSATGAHAVSGPVRDAWAARGWERSFLGYPTGDAVVSPDGASTRQAFQGGSITWSASTGAVVRR